MELARTNPGAVTPDERDRPGAGFDMQGKGHGGGAMPVPLWHAAGV